MKAALIALLVCFCLGSAPRADAAPVSASSLLGAEVVDGSGKRIGIVDDLAVDPAGGQIRYAMVRTHDSVRGARLRAVPLEALSPGIARDQLVLREEAGAAAGGSSAPSDATSLMRASAILGRKVAAPRGGRAFTVRDLIVELQTGQVLTAIVIRDGATLEQLREVPLEALDFGNR